MRKRAVSSTYLVLLALIFVPKAEAFTVTKKPDNPTVIVEGVNNTVVGLEWRFGHYSSETLVSIFFKRARPGVNERTEIAHGSGYSSFNVTNEFQNKYRAYLPATLELLNVNNNEEYDYFMQLNYYTYNVPAQIVSRILVKVYVPASIVPLEEKKVVKKGDSVTLYCDVSGDPVPSVFWTQVSTGIKRYNERWVIADIGDSDLGKYQCNASNMYGIASDTIAILYDDCSTAKAYGPVIGVLAVISISVIVYFT